MNPTWDKRFINLAEHIAGWSKDPSTKVGAVITDGENRIVSTGYNGLPRGTYDSEVRLLNRKEKYNLIIHAEENALLYARQPLGGCTIYVSAMPPCSRCAAKIIQCGIARVVAPMPNDDATIERWSDDWIAALTMYDEAGVVLDVVEHC